MADKQISQLVAATTINNEDLLVIQQGQVAKKLSGEALALFVYSAAGSMIDEVNSAVEEAQAAVDELLEEKNTIAQTIADMAELGTDTTLTTPGMAADAKAAGDRIADVEKDALAGLNQKTISDVAIASFDDGGDDAPVKELIVNIDPVQDLHGQDAPYPAGGGKNKSPNVYYKSGTQNIFVGQSDADSYPYNLTAGQTYTFSCTITGNTGVNVFIREKNQQSGTQIGSTSADSVVLIFTPSVSGDFRMAFVCPSGNQGLEPTNLQLEEGLIATPYAPYENICPITGWTGCEVTRTGENLFRFLDRTLGAPSDTTLSNVTKRLFDFSTYVKGLNQSNLYSASQVTINSFSDGVLKFTATSSAYGVGFPVKVKPSTQYTFTADFVGYRIWKVFYKKDGTYITNTLNTTFTTTAETDFIVILFVADSSTNLKGEISNPMLVLGDTEQTCKPYSSTTLSVTFPSEAGTVYGGTVDVVSGVLTVDFANIAINVSDLIINAYGFFYFNNVLVNAPPNLDRRTEAVCDKLPTYLNITPQADVTGFAVQSNNVRVRIEEVPITEEGLATAKSMLGETIHVAYPLATPITYHLTPVEVRTLLKINNIWANTGNINTLIYRTIPITEEVVREIMGDYEEIIAGVESTGTATKNYYAGNLVIVNDILYKCLANVASGETFTPGAGGNVSQTTIADELATLQALYNNLGNLALLSYTTA